MTITFSLRQPWECPRCHKINGPHVDQCECLPAQTVYPLDWSPAVMPQTAPAFPGTPNWPIRYWRYESSSAGQFQLDIDTRGTGAK